MAGRPFLWIGFPKISSGVQLAHIQPVAIRVIERQCEIEGKPLQKRSFFVVLPVQQPVPSPLPPWVSEGGGVQLSVLARQAERFQARQSLHSARASLRRCVSRASSVVLPSWVYTLLLPSSRASCGRVS